MFAKFKAQYNCKLFILNAKRDICLEINFSHSFPAGHYPPATNHVIIQDRRRDDGDLALGMVAGAATGMALGSLFWAF